MRSTNIPSSAVVDATQRFMVTPHGEAFPDLAEVRGSLASTMEPCCQTWKSDEQKNQSRKSRDEPRIMRGSTSSSIHPMFYSHLFSSTKDILAYRGGPLVCIPILSVSSETSTCHNHTRQRICNRKIRGDLGNSIQIRKSSFHKLVFPSSISEAY